ncbi:hypothetical protein ACFSQ3_14520 [Sphingobacterium corticis]|uniref:Uncharacterized protein n=1 Tax=Sphingobacterium corticis TaxID=1812823 RepID=A0ABW5NMU4_9SPHI
MKWLVMIGFVFAVSDEPQSRPAIVPAKSIAEPLDELVPMLDSLSCKLEGVTKKIEKL